MAPFRYRVIVIGTAIAEPEQYQMQKWDHEVLRNYHGCHFQYF